MAWKGRAKNGQKQSVSEQYRGVDRFALAGALDIHGCDTRPLMLSDKYGIAFPLPFVCFDLQRSMDPAKPIFDSEWHGVQTVYYQNDDIPAEFLNASLWLSYLHGMDANVTWSWAREGVEPKKQKPSKKKKNKGSPAPKGAVSTHFNGSLVSQPQLLDAWGRNSVTVQRHAPRLSLSRTTRLRVRLLFSKPSAILDIKHLDTMHEAYESLDWLGVPLGFVMEEMLLAGFRDCDLLIIPAARHASPGVREAVARLSGGGVRVVFIGDECLTRSPQDTPLDKPAPVKADVLRSAQDVKAFQAAMRSAGVKQFAPASVPTDSARNRSNSARLNIKVATWATMSTLARRRCPSASRSRGVRPAGGACSRARRARGQFSCSRMIWICSCSSDQRSMTTGVAGGTGNVADWPAAAQYRAQPGSPPWCWPAD